jgi:hypothetical protein
VPEKCIDTSRMKSSGDERKRAMLWMRPRSGDSLYPAAWRWTRSSAVMLRSGACSAVEEEAEALGGEDMVVVCAIRWRVESMRSGGFAERPSEAVTSWRVCVESGFVVPSYFKESH